jgi:hypothetical protein
MHTRFWKENLREGDLLEDRGINEGTMLKYTIKKQDGLTRKGLIWLRIGTGEWLL